MTKDEIINALVKQIYDQAVYLIDEGVVERLDLRVDYEWDICDDSYKSKIKAGNPNIYMILEADLHTLARWLLNHYDLKPKQEQFPQEIPRLT